MRIIRSSWGCCGHLSRYYFFLTSSTWGLWHNEIHLDDELLFFPVRLPADTSLRREILTCVKQLRASSAAGMSDDAGIRQIEARLDTAIFHLFELSEAERDLVKDMCAVGIPFYYDSVNSAGARPLDLDVLPTRQSAATGLDPRAENRTDIRGYLETFLRVWNRELEPDGEFSWEVVAPGYPNPMLAVVFSAQSKGAVPRPIGANDDRAWEVLLERLAEDLRIPFHSDLIYVDGLVRAVSPTQIVIIKRNEGRSWTRSAAREDAEATLLKASQLDADERALA